MWLLPYRGVGGVGDGESLASTTQPLPLPQTKQQQQHGLDVTLGRNAEQERDGW